MDVLGLPAGTRKVTTLIALVSTMAAPKALYKASLTYVLTNCATVPCH